MAQDLTGTLKKIKETGTITIGHRDASVPFSYYDDKQQVVGYAHDICLFVAEEIKRELKLPKLEVKLNPDGQYMIFKDNDENWNYLYKQVRWSDANLMYQAFAYSNKPELYDHPYHKSNQAAILAPVNDFKKIKWSFFISGERFDYILKRKN